MIYSISTRYMSLLLPKSHKQKGQILIGVLVAITIFLILAHALFTLISSSFELVSFNKARITARHLAQEKMELIKNLSYDNVATIGGIPSGTLIPQTETVYQNGLTYTIKTSITYVDDPFDDVAPADSNPEDYKRVRVEVSWQGVAQSRKNPVVLVSDISAYATGTSEGGSLIILVFDANGDPVNQAEVIIEAPLASPPVDLTLYTNSDGKIVIPGATPCVSCYHITATKTGYSTDRTYSTSEVTNPVKPDTSVFTDDVTQISFAIDALGSINISSLNSRENYFTPLGSTPFRIRGNKIIGTDATSQLVYKYDLTTTTDESGNKTFNKMEWDAYTITMPLTTSYDISGTAPLLPINLAPGGNADFSFTVTPHTGHSFLITLKDPAQDLIASASARLSDGLGFDETKFTGETGNIDEGQVFFPGLSEETYQLNATASGYLDFSGNYDVSGYTKSDVVLTPE
jgi:hypothetical protein